MLGPLVVARSHSIQSCISCTADILDAVTIKCQVHRYALAAMLLHAYFVLNVEGKDCQAASRAAVLPAVQHACSCSLQLRRHQRVCPCSGGCDGPPLPGLQAVAFGMGGGLLQRVNRDTMSFGEPC